MNLESLGLSIGDWLVEHPRAARNLSLCLVAVGTWTYLKLLRTYAEFDVLLREHADAARAASEALGG